MSSDVHQTLAHVIAHIEQSENIASDKRSRYVSAVRRMAQMLGHSPADLSADIRVLRPEINQLHPVQLGISAKRLSNVKADFVAALRQSHGQTLAKVEPSCQWMALLNRADQKWQRYTLIRFARFCTSIGMQPQFVSDDALAAFQQALDRTITLKDPAEVCKSTAQTWNGLVSQYGLALPRLTIAKANIYRTLPFASYPTSFQLDVAAWEKRLSTADLFSEEGLGKPLRPVSIRNTKSAIRQSAMALVRSGYAVEDLTSLADLVSPNAVKQVLNFFVQRNNGKPPTWLGPTIAAQLLAIARHHAKLPDQDIRKIQHYKSKLPSDSGMTQKNKRRLQQFDHEANVYRLVSLPSVLMKRALKEPQQSSRTGLLAMRAVAIEILLNCPLRAESLSTLNVQTDFKWNGSGKNLCVQVSIPAERVKNREPIEFDLNPASSQMIKTYLDQFRLLLSLDPGPWLFPAYSGGHRDAGRLSETIKEVIFRELGLTVNAHLFRHLALELQDRVMPGQYETGRLLLGHKRSKTTLRFYAARKGKRATATYQQNVLSKWKKK